MKKLFILITLCFLITGCANYTELNNLAIIDMIGLEKKENTYYLYLSTVTPEKEENKTTSKHKIYQVSGNSLGEVFQKGEEINNKDTYYNHLSLMILHSSTLKEDYKELFSFLKKQFQQGDYPILETKTSLNELFNQYSNHQDIEKFVLKEQQETGSCILLTFDEINANDQDQQYNAYLPIIDLEEEELKTQGIHVLGNELFYNNTLSRTSYLLSEQINQFSKLIIIENDYYQVKLEDLKSKITWKENHFYITISSTLDSEDLKEAEKNEAEEKIKKELEEEINHLILKEQQEMISTTPLKNNLYLKLGKQKDLDTTYKNSKLEIKINLKWKGERIYEQPKD